jgi:UDP-N-acetylmuramoyl-L-alanyl-D-glutamate--2,6-diaminopimelate ligase
VNEVRSAQVTCNVLGHFNIDNLLATAGSLLAINLPFDTVIELICQCHAINGRMQRVSNDQQRTVVIDFAHTPDALEKALQSLRHHMPPQGQLWCVFGCGGDRDVGKRPLMGETANHYADLVVLTADNPRSEDNQTIVTAILTGIDDQDKTHVEHDRKQAICYAISHAKQQDIVLIAGKGHEQYQEIAGVKQPFNDRKVAIEALAAANDEHSISLGVNT